MRLAIPGQTFGVRVFAASQSLAPVKLDRLSVEAYQQQQAWRITGQGTPAKGDLVENKPVESRFDVTVPENATFTRPYFSRPDLEQSYYDISDDRFLNQPLPPYPVAAWADFSFEGAPIRVGQFVQTVKRVAGLGSVYEPLAVGPAIGIEIAPRAGVVPLDAKSFPVTAVVHSNVKGPAKGSIRPEVPAGWRVAPPLAEFATAADGQEQSATFTVTPSNLGERTYQITAVAEHQGKTYREGYELTGYAGVRPYFLYRPST